MPNAGDEVIFNRYPTNLQETATADFQTSSLSAQVVQSHTPGSILRLVVAGGGVVRWSGGIRADFEEFLVFTSPLKCRVFDGWTAANIDSIDIEAGCDVNSETVVAVSSAPGAGDDKFTEVLIE